MLAASRLRPGHHPAGSTFGPASVAGLQTWVKADSITPVTDATDVSTWADSSGAGHNATAVGTAPKFYNSVVNGKPIVRWAVGDSRYTTGASTGDAAQTIMVVANVFDLSSTHALLGCQIGGGITFAVHTDGSLRVQVQGVTGIALSDAGVVIPGQFQVYTVSVVSGAQKFYVDGTAVGTGTGTFSAPSADLTEIGSQAGANNLKGDARHFIRYTGVIADADRIALHATLGTENGITMGGA